MSRSHCVVLLSILMLGLGGCGSGAVKAQKRAYKAQEKVATERLELVDKYQDCVEDAGSNAVKADACESYLRAAEALQ